MGSFPYFGFPYNYKYYNYLKQNNSITSSNKTSNTINPINKSKKESSSKSTDSDNPIFEIFGIKLYFDDIVIMGLLFFLYQENVKDEMLYIILFLLLFS